MGNDIRTQEEILKKLQITALNAMQQEAIPTIAAYTNTIILSPTGTGKTLAFLLPLIKRLDTNCDHVQALILVPTRELAIQIEQVARDMGTGHKVNAVYGGRPISKDKIETKHNPAILVGTPGRVLDHFYSERFAVKSIKTLILDEFDKSLEIGFEDQMRAIIEQLTALDKRVLTSATQGVEIPDFVQLDHPKVLNYLNKEVGSVLFIKKVTSPHKNKLQTLLDLINHLGHEPGIIFCNFKDTIAVVSDFLEKHRIRHGCFSGGMEQKERERALIKFRNGTSQILVATDLAARGIDIPELKFIIHFEMPIHEEEFIHRNGRTARVNAQGTAYIIKWKEQSLPESLTNIPEADISKRSTFKAVQWQTLFISGGRKDKISKGDIAGLFLKLGNLNTAQLGTIELKQDCAFVAVPAALTKELIETLNNAKLKKKKVRIYLC